MLFYIPEGKRSNIDPSSCIILDNRFIEHFILSDEPFAKALRLFETSVLVNNNLSGKLVSSLKSPAAFDERLVVASAPFFIPDFNLLSCELSSFTFKLSY